MFDLIPLELRERKQWVSVSIEPNPNPEGKPLKVPYVSLNGKKASTTRPETWSSFEDAVSDVVSGKRDHIGYVLSNTDPYFFIDLDDPSDPDQQKALARFDTYMQRSVSGTGIHIIGKGSFEGGGRHPRSPEAGLFQEDRYILFTGDVINGKTTINTVSNDDLQSIHDWLSSSKSYPAVELEEVESDLTDEEVFAAGCKRFDKFNELTEGRWEQYSEYRSSEGKLDHSSADHALIAMLCDLTRSNSQIINLFSRTGMWSPEREEKKKGLERYVTTTIRKIRAKQASEAARFNHITLDFAEKSIQKASGVRNVLDSIPDGLIKQMADWIWQRSEYPLQEAAIAAAFTVMSTVAGRNFQTFTRSGLNVWMILLADTGHGKNEYQNGIGSIVKKVSDHNKFGKSFIRMFSGEMASGQAVEDVMATRNRCMAYFPEFDDAYQSLNSPNSAPHFRSLKKAILNAYMQSGRDGYLSRRMKARQKGDEAPDETPIQSPNLVLAGECTPAAFYSKVTAQDAATGFLQRFSVYQAQTESASRRPSPNAGIAMPEELLDELLELFVRCDEMEAEDAWVTVVPDKEALRLMQVYRDEKKDATFDTNMDETTKQFYTRAGLKVIRFASLLAISSDFRNPTMRKEHVEWAIAFVEMMDNGILDHFKTGGIGTGQTKQEHEILSAFEDFSKMSTKERLKIGMTPQVAANRKILPHSILKKRVIMSSTFSGAQYGAVTAFENCLKNMAASGQIMKVPGEVAEKEFDMLTSLWCIF